eukprot:359797-Chlamydomonas_euryale.AAC.1
MGRQPTIPHCPHRPSNGPLPTEHLCPARPYSTDEAERRLEAPSDTGRAFDLWAVLGPCLGALGFPNTRPTRTRVSLWLALQDRSRMHPAATRHGLPYERVAMLACPEDLNHLRCPRSDPAHAPTRPAL